MAGIKALYRALSAISLASWIWGLPYAAFGAVIGAWAAWYWSLPLPLFGLPIVGLAVLAYVLYVARLVHLRSQLVTVDASKPSPSASPPSETKLRELPELERYFFDDFSAGPKGVVLQLVHDQEIVVNESTVQIKYLLVLMFDANAKLLAVYIPHSKHTVEIALHVAENIEQYIDVGTPDPAVGGPGHEETRGSELKFTGKVFLYHESALPLAERGKIDAAYRDKGLSLQMRGTDYALHTSQAEESNTAQRAALPKPVCDTIPSAAPKQTTSPNTFPEPYKKAVLELKQPKVTKMAGAGGSGEITAVECALIIESRAALHECQVWLGELRSAEKVERLDAFVRTGRRSKDGVAANTFSIARRGDTARVMLVHRNLADVISNPPFLLLTDHGDYALSDNTNYRLDLELRSEAQHPTKVTLLITTGAGHELDAAIESQTV